MDYLSQLFNILLISPSNHVISSFNLIIYISLNQVSSIVGRSEVLSAIFFIASLISYFKLHDADHDQNDDIGIRRQDKDKVSNARKKHSHKLTDQKVSNISSDAYWRLIKPITLCYIGFLCKEQSLMALIVCLSYEIICYYYHRTLKGRQSKIKLSRKILSNIDHAKRVPPALINDNDNWIFKLSTHNNNNNNYKPTPGYETLNYTPVPNYMNASDIKLRTLRMKSSERLIGLRYSAKDSIKRMMTLITAFITPLLIRTLISSSGSIVPTFNKLDNPVASGDKISKTLTYSYLSVYNFYLIILPSKLSCDWTHNSIPIIDTIWRLENVYTIIFCTSLITLLIRLHFNISNANSVGSIRTPDKFLSLSSFQVSV